MATIKYALNENLKIKIPPKVSPSELNAASPAMKDYHNQMQAWTLQVQAGLQKLEQATRELQGLQK
jgi:hypothetical protein